MKHGLFRTSVNRYQIIEYALLSYLSVCSALSREATDTGWMNVSCADAEESTKGTGKRIEEDNRVANHLTQGQAGAENDR